MCYYTCAWFTETGAVTQRVIKSHQIAVYGATLLVKIGGPWTRSMIGGSMDPVFILKDPVHGPGPRKGSMDQGSMFCTFPQRPPVLLNLTVLQTFRLSVCVFANLLTKYFLYLQLWKHRSNKLWGCDWKIINIMPSPDLLQSDSKVAKPQHVWNSKISC